MGLTVSHPVRHFQVCIPPEAVQPEVYTHQDISHDLRFVDKRSTLTKIIDCVLAQLRDIVAMLQCIPNLILIALNVKVDEAYCYTEKPEYWNKWKENSTGLHMLTHGFMADPPVWDKYIRRIRKLDLQADIRAPFVPRKGNCNIEEATAPLRKMVLTYIEDQIERKSNGEIPVHLYGISNGTRINLHLLPRLTEELVDRKINERLKAKNLTLAIKTDGIAGPLRGSTNWRLRFGNSHWITRWIGEKYLGYSLDAMDDFKYQSPSTMQLIETIRKIENLPNVKFKFNFYASTEDGVVVPYSSSLPVLGIGETHHIVHGHEHTSIINHVLPIVLETNAKWIEEVRKVR